ncbi:hypothetical protein [Actinoplanes palleronii]|uniref:hypothetical protein n=1 Tax=Actinoplanes palleronii TaxID=113570 RepID=UPI001941D398|nr:hypothetical protein [Actinoplanes palleronii]
MLDTNNDASRRALLWRLAGLGAGLAAAVLLAGAPASWLGRGLALAAPAFALCLLAGVTAGELTARVPAGATRTASLEVRTTRSFLPRRMARWVAGLLVLAAAFFTATGLAADTDDMGRAGRSLTAACGDLVSSTGPWPGRFYSVPIALAVLLGLGAAGFAMRTVVGRGRPVVDGAGRAADDEGRRTSARAILAACGVLVAAPLAGSALFAAGALGRVDCPSALYPAAQWAALAVAAVAGFSACVFTAYAVRPGTR